VPAPTTYCALVRRGAWGPSFAAVAVSLLAGCGGDSSTSRETIEVKLEDFLLHVSATTAAPGELTMHLENDGPSTHEINVDRTDLPADALPLRTDGLSVEEDSPQLTRIDSVEILEAGDRKNFKVKLPPGHYVLYCNLEGHYLGKMYATLVVN
jgi:uncharacterized cupredoxin-like copper-binding protein